MALPTEPDAYRAWLDQIERDWKAGRIPDPPAVAVIVVNRRGEVLLQLREGDPRVEFSQHWTLPGGAVENHQTPEQAAARELAEETGLELALSLWKVYRRHHHGRGFSIQQHVYTGQTELETDAMRLGEGQALHLFAPAELAALPIAYGFRELLTRFLAGAGRG